MSRAPSQRVLAAALFALSALFGLYVLHALSRVREGAEVSEREVIRTFVLEAGRMLESLSTTAASSLESLFPFGRIFDRRRRSRS